MFTWYQSQNFKFCRAELHFSKNKASMLKQTEKTDCRKENTKITINVEFK